MESLDGLYNMMPYSNRQKILDNLDDINYSKRSKQSRQPIENWLMKQDQSKTIHEVIVP